MGGIFCPIRAALIGSMGFQVPEVGRASQLGRGGGDLLTAHFEKKTKKKEKQQKKVRVRLFMINILQRAADRWRPAEAGRQMVSPANWEAAGLQQRREGRKEMD